MTFGEKVRAERKKLHLTQEDLAGKLGVSRRTVFTWESGRARPRTRETYEKLAEALNVPLRFLLTDDEAFVLEAGSRFGSRGKREAEELTREITGLFAGGEMAEEDMDALMFAVQQAYVEAKTKNRKYTPKKYREDAREDEPEDGAE